MFRAVHIFGPLQPYVLTMGAPKTPKRLWYGPAPWDSDRYLLISHDEPPTSHWPGTVEYALDRERSELTPHPTYPEMEEGTAVYVLCEAQ